MFSTVNLLDLLEIVGEETADAILSDFSCEKNSEIEGFVRKNAVNFAKKKMSITYLVFDEMAELAGVFTLTHKAIQISNTGLSKSSQKKIQRFAQINQNTLEYSISAFLIAQFGKNSDYKGIKLDGVHLMELTLEILLEAQKIVGGGVVYLECEEKEVLLNFYQKEELGFKAFNERYSDEDDIKYIQLFRFI